MHFTPASTLALAACISLASGLPADKLPRDTTTLQPWIVSSVESSSPSTRSNPPAYNSINVTITDPNVIPINGTTSSWPNFSAVCSLKWLSNEEPPYGVSHTCIASPEHGEWLYSLEQIGGAGVPATQAFGLKLSRVAWESVDGNKYTGIWDGNAAFAEGSSGNLQGTCGSEGNCLWQLKGGKPVEVLQTQRGPMTVTPL